MIFIASEKAVIKFFARKFRIFDQVDKMLGAGGLRDMYVAGDGDKYEVFCIYNAADNVPTTIRIADPYGKHYMKKLKISEMKFIPR